MIEFFFRIVLIIVIIIIFSSRAPSQGRREKLQYGYPTQTNKGEKVKSHAERTLADYFLRNGIKYEYEYKIQGIGNPDFYLPDYDVVVEYWGLVDADDESVKTRYIRTMRWKMAQYHSRKIKFISIYPRNMSNLDAIFKSKFKQVTGQKLH